MKKTVKKIREKIEKILKQPRIEKIKNSFKEKKILIAVLAVGLIFVLFLIIYFLLVIKRWIIYRQELGFLFKYYQMEKEVKTDLAKILSGLKNNKIDFLLIDVREKKDFEKCHFKNALNLSLNNRDFFTKVKKEMKNKKEIIVYSSLIDNQESINTVVNLLKKGFLARFLSVDWLDWKYIYARELFIKGENLNWYVEPEGCLPTEIYINYNSAGSMIPGIPSVIEPIK